MIEASSDIQTKTLAHQVAIEVQATSGKSLPDVRLISALRHLKGLIPPEKLSRTIDFCEQEAERYSTVPTIRDAWLKSASTLRLIISDEVIK